MSSKPHHGSHRATARAEAAGHAKGTTVGGKPLLKRWLTRLGAGGVTREDVVWCYRTLLGREPESEAALREHLLVSSLKQLVQVFLESAEFADRRMPRRFHPIPLPAARIDTQASAGQLAAAVAKVRSTWAHLGQHRPHFSVLTDRRFLPQNLPDSIDDFWATGEHEARQVAAMLSSHGFRPGDTTCIEYGCGVGRVTMALARHFTRVIGYDISDHHLAQARQRIEDSGLANVELQLCSEAIVEDLHPCDVFYSRIVLQHNPPPLMLALVRKSLEALRPGGIAIFQLPVYFEGYAFDLDGWLASPPADDMEMHCLPQALVFQAIAEAGCTPLEVREDDSAGDSRYISNLFIVQRPHALVAAVADEPA